MFHVLEFHLLSAVSSKKKEKKEKGGRFKSDGRFSGKPNGHLLLHLLAKSHLFLHSATVLETHIEAFSNRVHSSVNLCLLQSNFQLFCIWVVLAQR